MGAGSPGTWPTAKRGSAMAASLLALDMGTSSVHCMITDGRMTPIAARDAPIGYFTPDSATELAREFDPQEVMDTVDRLVAGVLKEASITGKDIKAIGITGQRQGVVFVDDNGRELLASPNMDLRAAFEGAALDEELGPTIYRTCGHFPSLLLAPARLRWLRHNMPEVYSRLGRLLTVPGWLVYRLTDNAVCEPSLAAAAGLLEVSTRRRCDTLLDKLDVPDSLLPPLFEAGEVVGGLSSGVAGRWGLPSGTPVTLAGADTQCGLLGMGLASYGEVGAIAGWSCALQMLSKAPCYDDTMNSWTGCYPVEDLWVAESNLGDAGNAHRWLKETLLSKDASWERVNGLASAVPSGSNGVHCYLGPSPWSAARAGLRIGGLLFPTPLRYQESGPELLLHAFWESLAYSLKANQGTLERITGLKTDTLYLGGGMAQSDGLARVIADVLDRNLWRSNTPQVSCRGAAAAAAVAAGIYVTTTEAAQSLAPMGQWVEPDRGNALEYEDHYQEWVKLYDKLQDGKVGLG